MDKNLVIKASNSLNSIDDFEAFVNELDDVVEDSCLNAAFKDAILLLADNETARLNKILGVL